jgi:hypothetical protein
LNKLPPTADCERHAALVQQMDELRDCREALRPWCAGLQGKLLDKRLAYLGTDEKRAAARLA